MLETAEIDAECADISRETQEAYALESHQRSALRHAQVAGIFNYEIVPLAVRWAKAIKAIGVGELVDHVVSRDECHRPDITRDSLGVAKLFEVS